MGHDPHAHHDAAHDAGKRHEPKGLAAVVGNGGTGLANRGALLAQEVVAGGTVRLPGQEKPADELAAQLATLAPNAELRAIAAVRTHARESVTLGDAHWRDIRCVVAADEQAGEPCVLVRVLVGGVAVRSLGGDALAGASAALTSIAEAFPCAVIDDLRVFAIDVEGRTRHVHCEQLPADVDRRLPPARALLANVRCAVVTLSDRASQGVYEDKSGARLADIIALHGGQLVHKVILPDDGERLALEVEVLSRRGDIELVICTGGTGIGPRDITPETLLRLGIRPIPGISELLRGYSAGIVRSAWLSRAVAGTLGHMVVIALPGSHKAVAECMDALLPLLPHTLSMLRGGSHG